MILIINNKIKDIVDKYKLFYTETDTISYLNEMGFNHTLDNFKSYNGMSFYKDDKDITIVIIDPESKLKQSINHIDIPYSC